MNGYLLPLLAAPILLLLAWLYHWMARVEPSQIEITHHDVLSPDIPAALDGLRICQLADLHIGATPRNQAAVAAALRSVRADLYVLTGDMIYRRNGIPAFFRWLDVHAELLRPAVAVLGNAEHKLNLPTQEVSAGLAQRGIPVLNNAVLRLPVRGATLQIVGVDDPHTEHSNFGRAYADACPKDWTLLLCHSPDGLCDLGSRRADLILCGHTHGGQMRLPWIGAPLTNLSRARGLVAGWYAGEELSQRAKIPMPCGRLYVSRGLGTGGFRGRLLCRPELPVFTLRSVTST